MKNPEMPELFGEGIVDLSSAYPSPDKALIMDIHPFIMGSVGYLDGMSPEQKYELAIKISTSIAYMNMAKTSGFLVGEFAAKLTVDSFDFRLLV